MLPPYWRTHLGLMHSITITLSSCHPRRINETIRVTTERSHFSEALISIFICSLWGKRPKRCRSLLALAVVGLDKIAFAIPQLQGRVCPRCFCWHAHTCTHSHARPPGSTENWPKGYHRCTSSPHRNTKSGGGVAGLWLRSGAFHVHLCSIP